MSLLEFERPSLSVVPGNGEESRLVQTAAAAAVADLSGVESHDVALICGSGFSGLAANLPGAVPVDLGQYGLRHPQMTGRKSGVYSARIGERSVLVFAGRSHLYEGVGPDVVVEPVQLAAACGVEVLVQTTAAGAIGTSFTPGQLVRVADHINMTGESPLVGPTFVPLDDAYDPELRELAASLDPYQTEGVYAAVRGPQYETPAEVRAYRAMGIDLVGMSTVLETIAARHLGLRVAAFSFVANMRSAGIVAAELAGEVETTRQEMFDFLVEFIAAIPVFRHVWTLDDDNIPDFPR